MPERKARILNSSGLHARPSTALVKLTNRFRCRIEILTEAEVVNAKSVMEILTLAAACGTELRFRAEGEDAEDALDAIVELVNRRFGTEAV